MTKPNNANIMDDFYTFDVYKVYLIDPETGLELYSDSLTDTALQFKEDIKEIRAGVGNKLLTDVASNKDISVEVTDVKTRLDWLAAKQGAEIATGIQTAWHLPKTYIAGGSSTITVTLDNTPKTSADVRCMKKNSDGSYTDVTGTIATNVVTFATGVVKGDEIVVTGFAYETPATTKSIDFDTEKFGKSFKVILEGMVFDGKRKPRFKKQYLFHKGSLDGNSEDTTKSERDASQTKTTIKIGLEAGKTSLGTLMFIPLS